MQSHPLTKNRLGAIYLLLIISLMAGCAGLKKAPQTHYQGDLAALLKQHWQADGKLAIRQIGTSNTRQSAHTLRFDWHQQGEDYTVLLSGPLGFGRVEIQQSKQIVSLTRGKTRVEANNADQLFFQQTGLSLPVSYLRYWALGVPAPQQRFTPAKTAASDPQAAAKLIKGFKQDGWQVSYTGARHVAPYTLPLKLTADNGDIKVVIAFKRWDFAVSAVPVSSAAK